MGPVVQAYFEEPEPEARAELGRQVETLAEGDLDAVAEALGEVQLWGSVESGPDNLLVDVGDGKQHLLRVQVPSGYDPSRRHQLILALLRRSGPRDGDDLRRLAALFPNHIVASVEAEPVGFHAPRAAADDVLQWLLALRRAYHVDTDAVYLYGRDLGGDAAAVLAIMHADLFAGVAIRDGAILDVPYGRSLTQLLLGNLSRTPVRLIFANTDLSPLPMPVGRRAQVAFTCHLTGMIAHTAHFPLQCVELSVGGSGDDALAEAFRYKRRDGMDLFGHRFRYPPQGRTRFLRVGEMSPPVWEGDQLDIMVRPGAERLDYPRSVLTSKLGFLEGNISGQNIRIRSGKCRSVEIRLECDSVDYRQPIHITYNGKRRYSDHVRPSIATVLEEAYENWEFQHPVCLRLRIGDRGPVRPF